LCRLYGIGTITWPVNGLPCSLTNVQWHSCLMRSSGVKSKMTKSYGGGLNSPPMIMTFFTVLVNLTSPLMPCPVVRVPVRMLTNCGPSILTSVIQVSLGFSTSLGPGIYLTLLRRSGL